MSGRALQTLLALALAGLWAAALGFAHWRGDAGLLDRAEAALTDLRTLARGARPAPDRVIIVAIDDEAVRKRGSYPLPRGDLARIVETIAQFEPQVIVVDLLLLDHSHDAGDQALAEAFGKRPTAIAAAAIFSQAR